MIGSFDSEVWLFCMMGKLVEDGAWPHTMRRIDWARDYRGAPMVAYGHTPVRAAVVVNNTVNLDQGCVFGGSLSALRYPEHEVVSVRAARPYFLPGLVP
jgi:protein phosphatase